MKIEYAEGTYLLSSDYGYWGGRAKCPDGVVRKLKRIARSANTFFSVDCAIDAFGKTVTGFVSLSDEGGTSAIDLATHASVLTFIPYSYGVNGEIFNDRMSDDRKERATTDATS